MTALRMNIGQEGGKLGDGKPAGSAYADELSKGLPVTYTIDPTSREENCTFTGPDDALETIVWRYVTPLDMVIKGEYLTAETADATNKEEFEHFLYLV